MDQLFRLVTRRMMANGALARWENQYRHYEPQYRLNDRRTVDEIHKALVELGDTPNPDDIDKVIGNEGWTRNRCDCCAKEKEVVLIFGQYNDSHIICDKCCKQAMSLFDERGV